MRLKNALIVLTLKRGLTPEASQYIYDELNELGISIKNDNIRDNGIIDIMVRSNLLGEIFTINSSDVYVYHDKLWPLYKAMIKIAKDARNMDTLKKMNKISERDKMFDDHMKDFDVKTFKITSKMNT